MLSVDAFGLISAVFTAAVLGVALRDFVNPALLQLLVGTLLLVFGLQCVRKAVLRSAGLKALHDETEIFAEELAEARAAQRTGSRR